MVKKKRQSKRVTLKDKYKIERKVRAHNRKKRREARVAERDGSALRKIRRKDPGLPNLLPYKEKFLQKLKAEKQREIQQQTLRMTRRRDELARRRAGPSAEELGSSAQRAEAFDEKTASANAGKDGFTLDTPQSKKKRMYMKEMRSVVDSSDVVLLVLDARDPLAGRAPIVEKLVLENSSSKRLVLVLNKIDLVPKKVVDDWLTYCRKEFPTVAFRASTQNQRSRLGRAATDSIALGTRKGGGEKADVTIGESVCVGADTLLQLLKNYSRNRDIKTAITVGVVGYPNVGKSSLINSLKRCRAVGVSPTPGFTKNLQVVHIDKKVKVIDSPGVLFHDSMQKTDSSPALVLQNCINPSLLNDPIAPVNTLFAKSDHEKLMMLYKISRFNSVQEFLALVAKKRGKLKAGGVPDTEATARLILQDWCAGKIPYYSEPPKEEAQRGRAEVVSTWSKEFDMDALLKLEQDQLVRQPDDMEDDVVMKHKHHHENTKGSKRNACSCS